MTQFGLPFSSCSVVFALVLACMGSLVASTNSFAATNAPFSLRAATNDMGRFRFELAGEPGTAYAVERTEDWKSWTLLTNVTMTGNNSAVPIFDSRLSANRRFYRAFQPSARAQEELTRARARWSALRRGDYLVSLQWLCFCFPDYVAPVFISVRNGAIEAVAVQKTNQIVQPSDWNRYRTIEGLFDLVQDAINRRAASISVQYHPEAGYPVAATIDYERFIADEEISFQLAMPNPPPVIVTQQKPEDLQLDAFVLGDATLEGETLVAEVNYGGGCEHHHFTLFMSPNSFLESNPVQANLYLRHDANGDRCKALISEKLRFDVRPIAALYRALYGRSDPIVLNIFAPPAQSPPRRVTLPAR